MYVDIYFLCLNISDSTLIHDILFLHLNYIIYIVAFLYQYQYFYLILSLTHVNIRSKAS